MATALATATECVTISGRLIPVPDSGLGVWRPENNARSVPPWNQAAADAHTDLAEVARRLETSLLNQVEGEKPRPRRGGSDGNTYAALRSVGVLCGRVESGDATRAVSILLRVAAETQRLQAVDKLTRWIRIRPGDDPRARASGDDPRLCPYCRTYSLRRAEGAYTIMCFGWVRQAGEDGEPEYVPCTDSDGNRPRAHLDASNINGKPVLAFADGLVIGRAA